MSSTEAPQPHFALLPEARSVVERASKSSTVLIHGEPGTGKELVARTIHAWGERSQKPFVAIDCARFSELKLESALFGHVKGAAPFAKTTRKGLFHKADQGTLYLAGVDKVPPSVQLKILRALVEKRGRRLGGSREEGFDVWVVAATEDLQARLRDGSLHKDLYRSLRVVTIDLPPLRKRWRAVEPLVGHFLWKHGDMAGHEVKGVSDQALQMLEEHEWPGNVEELETAVKGALKRAKADRLMPWDFPMFADARPLQGFKPSVLSDPCLLWHLLGLEELSLAPCLSFCNFLLERFLWAESPEIGEGFTAFTEPGWRKICAARRLATTLSLHQLDAADLFDKPGALARYLFLEHAEAETTVTGVLVLCQDGGWSVEILARGPFSLARPDARSVLAPALREGGALLLFHLAPGSVRAREERELAGLVAQAARLAGVHFLGSWLIRAPAFCEPLGPEGDVSRPLWPLQPPVLRSRSRAAEGFKEDLAEILGSAVASDVLSAYGAAELAKVPPAELSCPSLPAASARALASVLDLARRVGSERLLSRHALCLPEHLAREFASCAASSEPRGQMAVLMLDDTGRARNVHWLDGAVGAALRRRIVELAVADGVRTVVPVFLQPGSPQPLDVGVPIRGGLPSMDEASRLFDLRVMSPLILYEDGSWQFSDRRGRTRKRARSGQSELFEPARQPA